MNASTARLLSMLLAALAVPGCLEPPASEAVQWVGGIRFDRFLLLEETSETSANVSIGDVNADGHLDIVLIKGRHWPLLDPILLGDGAGSFRSTKPLSGEADRSYSGVLIDIDSDGDLDVVVSNDYPDPKLVYANDGTGEFTIRSTFGRPEWPTRYISVADLNGDDRPDIVIANRTGGSSGFNYVCFNQGNGQFNADCLGFSNESATTITPADFNRDGLPDLAVPHREGGQSYIYLNDEDSAFTERIPFGPVDAAIRSAEVSDFNGDGVLDIVVIDVRNGPAVLLGSQDGTFGSPTPLGGSDPTPYALHVADLDEDGNADILVGYVKSKPVVYFGDGEGGFSPVEFGDNEGVAYGFATGDVNEDGFMDIAMARSDAPNVLYFGGPAADAGR